MTRFDPDAKYVFIGDFSGQISVLRLSEDDLTLTHVTTLKGHAGLYILFINSIVDLICNIYIYIYIIL